MRRDLLTEDDRPWGGFQVFAENEPCTVKLITVRAGERLSLQRHRHRDELWVALDDGLRVEIDGETAEAKAGQRFFVPRGTTHRASGPAGGGEVRFLEVAFGEFDEDDIERLADDYGR